MNHQKHSHAGPGSEIKTPDTPEAAGQNHGAAGVATKTAIDQRSEQAGKGADDPANLNPDGSPKGVDASAGAKDTAGKIWNKNLQEWVEPAAAD